MTYKEYIQEYHPKERRFVLISKVIGWGGFFILSTAYFLWGKFGFSLGLAASAFLYHNLMRAEEMEKYLFDLWEAYLKTIK